MMGGSQISVIDGLLAFLGDPEGAKKTLAELRAAVSQKEAMIAESKREAIAAGERIKEADKRYSEVDEYAQALINREKQLKEYQDKAVLDRAAVDGRAKELDDQAASLSAKWDDHEGRVKRDLDEIAGARRAVAEREQDVQRREVGATAREGALDARERTLNEREAGLKEKADNIRRLVG